jgi:hypothetical protein
MNRGIRARFVSLIALMILLLSLMAATPTKAETDTPPCAIDLSRVQDTRVSGELRRMLQSDLHLYSFIAQRKPLPVPISYEWEVSEANKTYSNQVQTWPISCGVYLYLSKRKTTFRDTNGNRTEEYTDLYLGNIHAFGEHIDTNRVRSLTQLISLQASGPARLSNTGDRQILRTTYKGGFPDPDIWVTECVVSDSRPASAIAPRLTGNITTRHCKVKSSSNAAYESAGVQFTDYSYSWSQDCNLQGRPASEFHPSFEGIAVQFTCNGRTSAWLPDYGVAIPVKPKIERREATEFNSGFSGDAFVISDPATGWRPSVFFPALKLKLEIDTIDPAGLRVDPNKRSLLVKVEPIR